MAAPSILTSALSPPPDATTLAPSVVNRAWKAARDFEAMAVSELLRPMFETVAKAPAPFSGGEAEEAWQPMLVDAIGKSIAAGGGLGIAVPVFHEMLRAQEARAATQETVP
jgi:Rod binding domain-containing protein